MVVLGAMFLVLGSRVFSSGPNDVLGVGLVVLVSFHLWFSTCSVCLNLGLLVSGSVN